jgi:hypothetical protein
LTSLTRSRFCRRLSASSVFLSSPRCASRTSRAARTSGVQRACAEHWRCGHDVRATSGGHSRSDGPGSRQGSSPWVRVPLQERGTPTARARRGAVGGPSRAAGNFCGMGWSAVGAATSRAITAARWCRSGRLRRLWPLPPPPPPAAPRGRASSVRTWPSAITRRDGVRAAYATARCAIPASARGICIEMAAARAAPRTNGAPSEPSRGSEGVREREGCRAQRRQRPSRSIESFAARA